jgi:hypothetical protein
MSIALPLPVAAYLAADKDKDPDLLSGCFTDDALVHDEGRDYRGKAEIKAWKQGSLKKYQYVVEPLSAAADGDDVRVRARVTGTFPGSPVELDYTFTLANDKIARLEID